MLSLTVTDTQQQTREVMVALAGEPLGAPPNFKPWHALQRWLRAADRETAIPYAKALAKLIPPVAVRLRRDFGALLNLISTCAILHQASRERDAEGRIIATLEDYAAVRALVADLVSEGVEATVPATVRETVEKLARLLSDEESVTIAKLAEELELDKSSTWRRVKSAIDRGYVKNLEDRRGRPARLVLGDPLPDDIEILPTVERLHGCTVAGVHEGVETNFFPEEPGAGGNKKLRAYPSDEAATLQPSEPKQPLSFDLAPGESAALEELRDRREREEFVL